MPSFFEIIGEALQAYWRSPLSLSVLTVCLASMGTLLYVFLTNSRNAKLRVSLLTGLYALSIFFWAFVAGSLVLCVSQARMVAYARNCVPWAVLGGIVASAVVSSIVWKYGSAAVLRKLSPRELREDQAWLSHFVKVLGE